MNDANGCGKRRQDEAVEAAPRLASRTDDLVEESLRRLVVSQVSLGQAAVTMQLTRSLLGASYRRLGKIAQAEPAVGARAWPPVKPAIVPAQTGFAGGMIDMEGWQHPSAAHRAAGAILFSAGRHANDAEAKGSRADDAGTVGSLRAVDLACLAQAAILLGLSNAAEALTSAAYHVLNGDASAAVDDATDALRTALTIVRRSPLSDP